MPPVQRFEDLIAWQKARNLAARLREVMNGPAFQRDCRLRDQIGSAAVSIMANLAEGFERGGRGEFHHFVCIAKGSCGELRSHLYAALDAGYLDQNLATALIGVTSEVSRILGGLRAALARQRATQHPRRT
ncbi:MAG: four helix bundle protein [Gemmatimonadales bacterium]